MTTLPMRDLQRIKRSCRVTFNDVFLAVCGGGLRRYLDRRGELPDSSLIAGVPVATHLERTPLQREPRRQPDAARGIGRSPIPPSASGSIHEAVQAARRVREALGTDLFEYRAGLTPPHLYPLGIRLWARTRLANRTRPPINLIASNVAGPRRPLELDGGVVTALYSVGPILEGIGLNITAWSYVDRLFVSVLGCPASLPDPWAVDRRPQRRLRRAAFGRAGPPRLEWAPGLRTKRDGWWSRRDQSSGAGANSVLPSRRSGMSHMSATTT